MLNEINKTRGSGFSWLPLLSIVVGIPILTGCASIFYRPNNDYISITSGPYQSFKSDVQILDSLARKDYDPLLTGAEPLVGTLAAVDIPLAAVVDTILLPYDLIRPNRYLQRMGVLSTKYLSGYKIVKNPKGEEGKSASFYLVSPSGENIDLLKNRRFNGAKSSYPELDALLRQKSIFITSADDAREIIELINMLMYAQVITDKWKYVMSYYKGFWCMKIVDKQTGRVQLGHRWFLDINDDNILTKIVSRP